MKKKEIVESLVGLVAKQHEHMDTLLKSMAKHIPVKAARDEFFDELLWAIGDIKAACKRLVDERRKEQVKADKVLDAVVTEEPVEVCRHLTAVAEITSLVLRKDFRGARLRLKEFLQSDVSQAYLDALITRFRVWEPLGVLCIQLMEYPQVQTDKTEMMVAQALTYADELVDQLKELGIEVPSHDNLVAPGSEAESATEGADERAELLRFVAHLVTLVQQKKFNSARDAFKEKLGPNPSESHGGIWRKLSEEFEGLAPMACAFIRAAKSQDNQWARVAAEHAELVAKQLLELGVELPERRACFAEPDTKPTRNSAWVDAINNACKDPKMMDRLIEGVSMAADLQKQGIQTGGAFLVAHAVSSGQVESNTNDLPADAQVPKAIGPSAAVMGITEIVEATLRGEYEEAYALVMGLPGMRDRGKGKQVACKEYQKFDKLSFALRSRESQKDNAIEVARVTSIIKETATELAAELVAKGVSIVGYTAKPSVAKPKPSSVVGKDEYLDKSMWIVDEYRLKPITAVLGSCWLDGSRKKGELSDHGRVFLRLDGVPSMAVAELTDGEVYHMRIVEEELKKLGKKFPEGELK